MRAKNGGQRRQKTALLYHGLGGFTLFLKPVLFVCGLSLSFAVSGCGMTMQLDSLLPEKSKLASAGDKGDITGSIPKQAAKSDAKPDTMSLADWSLAGAALREALAGKDENASVPWRNPDSGSGGSVTLVASAYTQDGFPCRNFIASNVREGKEAWFSGTACRVHQGQWDIRSTRPLQRS